MNIDELSQSLRRISPDPTGEELRLKIAEIRRDEKEPGVRYHILTKVRNVMKFNDQWFVHFEGSWEALGVGLDAPEMKKGDDVHITFTKI